MRKIIIYILFLCLFPTSCNRGGRGIYFPFDGERKIVRIDEMRRFNNVVEIIPDEFIIERRYIKLHSTEENFLFGDIAKIRIVNDKIFIFDDWRMSLLVFDRYGFSKAKIGSRGQGPNEYLNITDFDVDSRGNIYKIDGTLDRLFVYNPDFSVQSVRALPFEASILHIIDDDRIMFGLSTWNRGNNAGASIIITDRDLNTLEVLAYHTRYFDNRVIVSCYSFVRTGSHIIYHRPINNNILLFSKEGVLEKIVDVDFGRRAVRNRDKMNIQRNLRNFDSYNLLQWITIVDCNFMIGTFWESRETKSFFIDKTRNEMFVSNSTIRGDRGRVAGFDDGTLIQVLVPGLERTKEGDLSQDIIKHLANGDFALRLTQLK